MEILAYAAFGLYVSIIAIGGVIAVAAGNLVRALVGLIMTLFGVAGMYLLMAAPVMAFMQLLIYVGAVAVLIFIAIMLVRTGPDGDETTSRSGRQILYALLGLAAPAVILSSVVVTNPVESFSTPTAVTVKELGKGLLGPYTLAFELISVVLLVAMAGAVLIAFERRISK
ncbi:NADH-ubiquinone/plastoquinone oxidoreductase chain 6 [uncultured Desulfobacterium sp.]|uniref:NADH-quinone oxidoreductase subunit J n=1 Tax=uncultured Desulfobacterium sp. TaxID=201089 RepID=A0A445MRY8_9BACT|nr:NADH-ubiquinone/plastoquinone oxidoreductase chain 6 [uncultured Desulfobacterium sp.]